MSNADPRGRFVWHELLTSDAAGAGAFYPKVVSWTPQPWDKDPSFTTLLTKAGPAAGFKPLENGEGAARWIGYVQVEDVHATVAQAKSLGARVVEDVRDIPEVGTSAVLLDPQGAEFGIHKPANPSRGENPPLGLGQFQWHELMTTDADAAVAFYTKLFGWQAGSKHDMGEMGLYHLILQGGSQYAGIFNSSRMPPNWLAYVRVADAGKAALAAKSAGGRVINGPMEIPGGSWIAQILDPEGVFFAVYEEKAAQAANPAAKPAPKPKAPKAPKPPAVKAAGGAAANDAEVQPAAAKAESVAPASRKATAQKVAPAKQASAKKAAAKKAPAKKAPAKKAAAKKAARKGAKSAGRKASAKKAPRKAAAKKKVARRKASAKKAPAKKQAAGKKAKKHR